MITLLLVLILLFGGLGAFVAEAFFMALSAVVFTGLLAGEFRLRG